MKKVWVNGVFDILHRGHLSLLDFAKSQGDFLLVGIDSDERVRQLKGETRPINSQEDRKYFLENLKFVDKVIIFNTEEELNNVIKEYSPDIFVVGTDYMNKKIIGKEWAKEIIFYDKIPGYATRYIINKIYTSQKTIEFKGKIYPRFQSIGNAAQFAIPFALYFCQGTGYDIGCGKEEWAFPGSIPIDPIIDNRYNAFNLPQKNVDYIFSSHCLEHIPNWVDAMDYWYDVLRPGGILFLYLPHYNQEYWRPWNNKKHYHCLNPQIIVDYMKDKGYKNIFYSERDLNDSFMVVGEKPLE